MKKIVLLLFILFFENVKAQITSVIPNQGFYGHPLITTITIPTAILSVSSGPQGLNEIYLQQRNTIIYSSNFVLPLQPQLTRSLLATFNIPLLTPPGLYDVHVITYLSPWAPPIDNVKLNAVRIGFVAGVIEGDVYYDANQNGSRDSNEFGLPNQQLNLNPTNALAFTDLNGHYIFNVDSGTHDVSVVINPPFSQTTSPLVYSINVPPDSLGNDFGLYAPLGTLYTQNFTISKNNMRCNSSGSSNWHVTNTSMFEQYGTVTVIYSSNLLYNSSNPAATIVSANTLSWNYQLNPFASTSANILYTNPAAGDTVSYMIIDSVFDNLGNFQSVFIDSFRVGVRCSYDPNDKNVSPRGENSLNHTLIYSPLTYTIRFQNTGNDTAYLVVLKDTLDGSLDINSLEILGSSHSVTLEADSNNILSFKFYNIMLPDSIVDEPGSHGYVIYRVNPIANIPEGTEIHNTAYIYFDFNVAVVTNTTLNTMVSIIPVDVSELIINQDSYVYPNPITDISKLRLPYDSKFELRIFDITGQKILNKTITEDYLLSKNKFSTGVFFFQLTDVKDSKGFSGKFVVID